MNLAGETKQLYLPSWRILPFGKNGDFIIARIRRLQSSAITKIQL
jgi:hypothetical protein